MPQLAAPAVELTNKASPRPLHARSNHAPGTFVPVRDLPSVTNGIPLPDGRHLPFLNGMTWCPPISRDEELGPVPPVVGLAVDAEGFEWWKHADGSATTSRYKHVTVSLPGQPRLQYWDPAGEHTAPSPNARATEK